MTTFLNQLNYQEASSMVESSQSVTQALPLTRLPKGAQARIVRLEAHGDFGANDDAVSQRLKELGFLPGAQLKVIGFGLFGGSPVAVQINGTKFALRTAEAGKIIVEPLSSDRG